MDTTRIFARLFPFLMVWIHNYKKALYKAHSTRRRLKFLKRCMEEQVIPKSLLPARLRRSQGRPFSDFCRISLKEHIQQTKNSEFAAFKCFRKAQFNFFASVPREWTQVLLDDIYRSFRYRIGNLQQHLDSKLNCLIESSDWNKNSRDNGVINISSKSLKDEVKCALGYGMSFAIDKKPSPIEVFSALTKLSKNKCVTPSHMDTINGLVYSQLYVPVENSFPLRFQKALNELKRDESLHITKADKSNVVVVMDKLMYIEKMQELLSDVSTYVKLRKNPLDDVIKHFNKKLKNILRDHKDLVKNFTITAPTLPYLYGLIKTHKPGNPVRPIISSVGSITYKLSKYLVKLLSPLLGTISDSHLKNSTDLIAKLSNINVNPSTRLYSFDVTSLFTKVPVDDLLDYLNSVLDEYCLPFPRSVIISLIELCVRDCKFTFQGEYYQQIFGMAMGNPLSPLLSNLYMEFFERNLLPTLNTRTPTWYRYVDDVIVITEENFNVDYYLQELNQLAPSIKFTSEKENNCSLPFLDVRIHRFVSYFKFEIYRKPTNTCSYIHFYSAHTSQIKTSVFSSMYLRALRIVSPEFFDNEVKQIKEIGKSLCYPINFLERAFCRAKKTFYSGNSVDEKKVPECVLSIPFSNNFVPIVPILKKLNIGVVFNFRNTISSMLIKNSPPSESNVIYQIPCKSCNKSYFGQTSKSLDVRLKQHKDAIRQGALSSALFVHWQDLSHAIDWKSSRILTNCNDYLKRNIMETAIINLTKENNMNLSLGMYSLDPIILDLMRKDLDHILKKINQRY